MTKQETFKRRVRTRMAKTGEKYGAARRNLIEQAASPDGRMWAAQPEMSDKAVVAATGRGWNEWCDLIEAWPGHRDGHAAIARYLEAEHQVDGWWAQGITVGYERIRGLRLPYQNADGTFTANKSKTVRVDAELLRKTLLHDEDRADLFPSIRVGLRSRPEAKTIRVGIGDGVAQIGIDALSDGRAKVTIQHERLRAFDDVDRWKSYWAEWLEAIDEE